MNLFLRDAFYNRYLCRKYGLAKAEALFEIPLDSVVAKALCCGFSDYTGLKWNGVGRLNWASSKRFQSLAAERSKKEGVTRVNLDALLWVKYRK